METQYWNETEEIKEKKEKGGKGEKQISYAIKIIEVYAEEKVPRVVFKHLG
jgi:hypothetical protein